MEEQKIYIFFDISDFDINKLEVDYDKQNIINFNNGFIDFSWIGFSC